MVETGTIEDDQYFKRYDDLEVHRLMLQDTSRTLAYQKAIETGWEAIVGKVVLDVGAGTGILSLFCARAGAKKVYAVEACDMALPLAEVVRRNGADDKIVVVHGRIEEVTLPEKVDVIVSEWMGFYLLHESMLDSVINARDRFLKEDGIMMPSHAILYVAPCSMDELWQDKFKFWDNVQGFDMSTFGRLARNRGQGDGAKPEVLVLKPQQILSDPQVYAEFDLKTVTTTDIDCIKKRHFVSVKRNGSYHGLALWFDCKFIHSDIVLSTSPLAPSTHWKQVAIVTALATSQFEDVEKVEEDDVIGWELTMTRAGSSDEGVKKRVNQRCYAIQVEALDPITSDHPASCRCMLAKCVLVQALTEKLNEEEENGGIMDLT